MNGTAHATIGGAVGFVTANLFQVNPSVTLLFVGLGTISALVPDLDIDGKLRGKLTLSHTFVRLIAQLIGILMIIYSFFEGAGNRQYLGMGIGLLMFTLSSRLKQKHMLTLTSIGVIAGGVSLDEVWLILFGVYMLIASFVPHRTYTHSILGVIFFGLIAMKLEASLGIEGVYYTCVVAYISHLIGDSKFLPINNRGIKLFLPLSSKEL